MSVANKFVRAFDAISRAGGAEDFERGLARLERFATNAVQFKIAEPASAKSQASSMQSKSSSTVVFNWTNRDSTSATFGFHCTCSAFENYPEPCHHAWTALLAFDQSTVVDLIEARTDLVDKTLTLTRLTLKDVQEALENSVDVEASSKWPVAKISPKGVIEFDQSENGYTFRRIGFSYGDFQVTSLSPRREFLDRSQEKRLSRNLSAEKSLLKSFKGEFAPKKLEGRKLSSTEFRDFVLEKAQGDWQIQIGGRALRRLEIHKAQLDFSADGFFDFKASFTTPDHQEHFSLRDVIAAPSASVATLSDGSPALMPDDWSRRLEVLSRGASLTQEGTLRFSRTALPLFVPVFSGVTVAPEAQSVFETLASLGETGQAEPPKLLKASLRAYQAEGLHWLLKMSDSGFGGILADDMGLGKTVQIISYLLSRSAYFRTAPEQKKPCLVVLPKSLVTNWMNEIEKFGPSLLVLDFAGANRVIFKPQHFDVVLTTYHVMKNEVDRLRDVEFDTIILDEAQAIKNPGSQISKAVFQLRARQRFALSGTPIENSLRDLFSLMHFTNPGLIPPSFDRIYGERKSLTLPKDVTDKIAASVKPFILRRTKKQVLKELPDKTEQVLMCEMEAPQKRLYDKTRRHFKLKLKEAASPGDGPGTTRVFEALLRLRQISCHPKLVGKLGESIESTKVEMLLEHLEDIRAAGNKALVFSQFTSFLDLLKPELEKAGILFEHLDGQTRNRGAVVERFNSNPKTTVFLISLKAGGTGLNLTTASYVFLMDPWWNPAIESQAIDRAYRMGQKQKVMAYRLIAKGTIEEKILKLQDQKRSLANSLISEDAFVNSLSLADLESLLEET